MINSYKKVKRKWIRLTGKQNRQLIDVFKAKTLGASSEHKIIDLNLKWFKHCLKYRCRSTIAILTVAKEQLGKKTLKSVIKYLKIKQTGEHVLQTPVFAKNNHIYKRHTCI